MYFGLDHLRRSNVAFIPIGVLVAKVIAPAGCEKSFKLSYLRLTL